MSWVFNYAVQLTVIICFTAIAIWAIKQKWDAAAFVFGVAVLVVGCSIVIPACP